MATFSTNQVRQFYVVKNLLGKDGKLYEVGDDGKFTQTVTTPGTAQMVVSKSIKNGADVFQIESINADGELQISDRINQRWIRKVNVTPAYITKKSMFTINASTIAAIDTWDADNELYFTITVPEFLGISTEDTFVKTVMVQHETNTLANDIANAIELAFRNEQGITVKATVSSNIVTVVFEPTKWREGVGEQRSYRFILSGMTYVYVDSNNNRKEKDVASAFNTNPTTTSLNHYIANSYNYKDLEWFCMGERGDMYRMRGYPNNIETRYMVDADTPYACIDVHYYFQDEGMNNQDSEKVMTLLVPYKEKFNTVFNSISTSASRVYAAESSLPDIVTTIVDALQGVEDLGEQEEA